MHLQIYTTIFILKWLVIQMIYPSSNSFLNEQKILWEINKAKDFFLNVLFLPRFICNKIRHVPHFKGSSKVNFVKTL